MLQAQQEVWDSLPANASSQLNRDQPESYNQKGLPTNLITHFCLIVWSTCSSFPLHAVSVLLCEQKRKRNKEQKDHSVVYLCQITIECQHITDFTTLNSHKPEISHRLKVAPLVLQSLKPLLNVRGPDLTAILHQLLTLCHHFTHFSPFHSNSLCILLCKPTTDKHKWGQSGSSSSTSCWSCTNLTNCEGLPQVYIFLSLQCGSR